MPKKLQEKYDILRNQVIDMQNAIIGWQEKLAFNNETELIDELERLIEKALKK